MRATILFALVLALAPLPTAAQGPPRNRPHRQMPADSQRRAQLEERVRTQFLDVLTRRLELDERQREVVSGVVTSGMTERRELFDESRRLRQRLMAAVQAGDSTSMSAFEALIADFARVRDRERELEARELDRLRAALDARQVALFLAMRIRFNDQIRGARGRGGPGR